MKKNYLIAALVLFYQIGAAQTISITRSSNYGLSSNEKETKQLNDPFNLTIEFSDVDAKILIELLKKDSIKYKDAENKSLYDIAVAAEGGEGNSKGDEKKIISKISDSVYRLSLGQEEASGKSFIDAQLVTMDSKNNKKAITFKQKETDSDTTITKLNSPVIIDDAMLAGISAGGCQLCDLYSMRVAVPNNSRHDRKYSTDYIIVYDPLLKKDAYTICKHVFEKEKDILYERYIKIAPMWFAPHVGSQIRFEVINQPLDKPFRLSVNETDVFDSRSTQFAALIDGLVNTSIINPILGDTIKKTTGPTESNAKTEDITQKLDAVLPQIAKYIAAFRISSCAIQQHNVNLPIIIARINDYFGLGSLTLDQLSADLKKKINDEEKDSKKNANAIKSVDNLIAVLKALENVQPLAYTTLRAKNRDYIEIKYTDANNVESKPENIRMSGGLKIDFSGGFVLTGLRDYSYALKDAVVKYTPAGTTEQRDTTGNVIIKEDEGKNQVGVCILSHFYPRISSHYNIGGTVGIMTSTNLNLRIMLGGSVMISSLFGSNNRISFSGGAVWGKVNRLSVQNEDYLDHPRVVNGQPQFYSQASAPQPISRSDHSWFFAVTMNFGGN